MLTRTIFTSQMPDVSNERITVRLSDELRKQVQQACTLTGLDEPTIIRECLKAFVEEVDATGEIRLPFALLPKSAKKHPPVPKAPPAPAAPGSAQTARTPEQPTGSMPAPGLNETAPGFIHPRQPVRYTAKKPARKKKP